METVALRTSTRAVIRVLRLRRNTSVPPLGYAQLYSRIWRVGREWFGSPQQGYGLPY
jgi:hypothetical protein